ncbi:hypothetical protein H257_17669 [Aphanomyces astaci]|uniref:Histone deacetylase domain-containing protein n=1 Tax=Aphanomyces astaci TaxID=112090 RepID=W4FFN0_APHAT|nr:hypothetical protein H257_17669 [Aphanomyces astaci]ETV65674.1 hypothetical protein H257_17669 [Aphanomyces astaci]|eukprot:XP_009844839.1 hypothetical protein H257_17669 [Aphanomyces astaci]
MADGNLQHDVANAEPATETRESDGEYEDGGSATSMYAEFWMHDLVELGNVDVLKAALDEDEEGFLVSLKEVDDMGCTPLHTAVLHPVESVLSFLFTFGPEALGLETACNGTPLIHLVLRMCTFAEHRAVLLPILRVLLTYDTFMATAIHGKDDVGNTIFHVAAMANVLDVFVQLEPSVAALEVRNRVSERPLHIAIKFRSSHVLQSLVHDHHVDIAAPTSFGMTPLHQAAASPDATAILPVLDPDWHTSTCKNGLNQTPLDVYIATTQHRLPGTSCGFLYHPDAMEHLPMAGHVRGKDEPPPENFERMKSLVSPGLGILRTAEFKSSPVTWSHDIPKADIADVLRIHDVAYVEKLKTLCGRVPIDVPAEELSAYCLDADTALSRDSYEAALRAAGNVCAAVDKVVAGTTRNAFCIVRPPGHHAGPVGKVTCDHDRVGSHGFCLLNNVAIGASYARSHFKAQGINKIAILDFDVHHGNGTEECIRHLVHRVQDVPFETPFVSGTHRTHQYKPWRSEEDVSNVFFCSIHGYGPKDPKQEFPPGQYAGAWFYPGSGESTDKPTDKDQPIIINVGLPYQRGNLARQEWRRVLRSDILPQLVAFEPDLIFLSAGFDGHRSENVNWGYVGLMEHDFEWLTQSVVKVANKVCNGRVISVLEGGYNFHGRIASPFCRSVAAHARALVAGSQTTEPWNEVAMAHEAACEAAMILDATAKKHKTVAKREDDPSRDAERVDSSSMETTRTSKRMRKEVDYVALAAELTWESAATK